MQPDVRQLVVGRWPGVLAALGVPGPALTGRHGPCPTCGGRDRFRFDDKEGRGTWICSHCGAGDGFKLVMAVRGVGFKEAAALVKDVLPHAPQVMVAKERSETEKRESLRLLWEQAQPVQPGDPVHAYLTGRGLRRVPDAVRYVPKKAYYTDGRKTGVYPAMVAVVRGLDGRGVSLHVTYLQDGKKAPVESPRKVMQPVATIAGCAVWIDRAGPVLGVAEGIETAIAAGELSGLPMWATVGTGGMESLVWLKATDRLVIFADNDANYAGQKAAYTLAFRAKSRGLDVEVRTPDRVGQDWNDVLRARAAATEEVVL